MYQPPAFVETRTEVMLDLIASHPLATVAYVRDGLEVQHIPMRVRDWDGSGDATAEVIALEGHIARANPLWKDLPKGERTVDVVAVFQGAQGYITPGWYESKREHGRVVPTWNYAVVHAHGRLRLTDDRDWLLAQVNRLTDAHEEPRDEAWAVSDAPERFMEGQLKGIIGVELEVSRLEGKWKMSQNRPSADQQGVISGLRADENAALANAVADAITSTK